MIADRIAEIAKANVGPDDVLVLTIAEGDEIGDDVAAFAAGVGKLCGCRVLVLPHDWRTEVVAATDVPTPAARVGGS